MNTVQIGKNGVTDGILIHIEAMLREHNELRVKMLKSFADVNDADDVATYFEENIPFSVEAETRGNVVTLTKT